jgi:two-component system cell cycle sensor histidine kinase/response regulator CckA
MTSLLQILHLEDDADDAELIEATLEAQGIHCAITRVQDQAAFQAALEGGGIDLILSDHSLPEFDGLSALKLTRATQPDLPFIHVSGTLGEELAIDSLKSGATDYVLKTRLARLVPAVRRAMQEVEERAQRRLLEARSIEAQKMEVIGQLASGVAHDFNNILAVIMGYSDLMASECGPDHPLQKHNEIIRQASERAVGLTRQLLIFSRKQTVQPVVLDLDKEIKHLDKMLRRLVNESVEMTFAPGNQTGCIMADSGYIGQVLMNLVVNARDAMPNGGHIRIAANNVTLDENHARAHAGAAAGDYVMLSVSDTGTGMSEEVKARMFEAFFTTKPKGKGTGLGLATCQTIVQQSGGHIDVCSELGQGTTFKIYFPRIDLPRDVSARTNETAPLPRGTETLMVVEDEPSVRHLARAVLQAQGYEVLSATNGQEAINLALEHRGTPVRLVVTDVIMPVMGGKVMAEWLRSTYPDLKILFTSGYTDGAFELDGAPAPGIEFLSKPYTPATLGRKVRDMLDAPQA